MGGLWSPELVIRLASTWIRRKKKKEERRTDIAILIDCGRYWKPGFARDKIRRNPYSFLSLDPARRNNLGFRRPHKLLRSVFSFHVSSNICIFWKPVSKSWILNHCSSLARRRRPQTLFYSSFSILASFWEQISKNFLTIFDHSRFILTLFMKSAYAKFLQHMHFEKCICYSIRKKHWSPSFPSRGWV